MCAGGSATGCTARRAVRRDNHVEIEAAGSMCQQAITAEQRSGPELTELCRPSAFAGGLSPQDSPRLR